MPSLSEPISANDWRADLLQEKKKKKNLSDRRREEVDPIAPKQSGNCGMAVNNDVYQPPLNSRYASKASLDIQPTMEKKLTGQVLR